MWLDWLERFRNHVINTWVNMWAQRVKVGEKIMCKKDVVSKSWDRIKWRVFELLDICIESQEWNGLWFSKRIKITWYPDELFNPSRFRKIAPKKI